MFNAIIRGTDMKVLLATLAIVLSVGAAHATTVSWTFQGNLVAPGSVPDMVGDVTITLDDEDTAGSVKLTIDASGLADGEFIRNVFFTTDFDVEVAPFLLFTPPDPFPSYFNYAANEDGFNPIADISADARINFNESPDPEFDNTAGLFEGIFERDGLLVSNFLTNDGGAPYEIAIQAKGLAGSGGNYFFGARVTEPPPDSDPDDRLIDLVTLGDVGDSSDVDLAVLDVALKNGDQLSARVHVRDGGTGNEIYQVDVSGGWRSLAIDTLIGNLGPLLAILQTNDNGDIRVRALHAEDGSYVKNVSYFDNSWTPIDVLSVSDAGGPGIAGIGVLAENQAGQQAVEVHKAGNGELVERVFYFNDIWKAWDAIDLGEFNGNGRSEITVLATNNAGKHAAETRDALSGKQISRQFFLGPTNTVIGVADVADLNNSGRPELVVLGNKDANNNTANTIQAKDVKTGDLIGKVGTYGPDWIGFGIRSIGDVNGNSAEEVVVAVLNTVDNSTSVSVRDVASNSITRKTGFLGPAYTPQDVEVLGDVSGNSIQEVVVGGVRSDNLAVRIQLRDASSGSLIRNIDLN
jgi:hypothetical protein